MRIVFALAVGLALTAAACRPDREEPARSAARALRGVLNYPQSVLVTAQSGEGGSEAGQLTFESPAAADTIAAWYRVFFQLNGWELRSDRRDQRSGQIVMYAERDSAGTAIPVWVMIQPFSAPAGGATYSLIGARPEATDTSPR